MACMGKALMPVYIRLWKGMVVTWKRKIAGINLLFQARLRIT